MNLEESLHRVLQNRDGLADLFYLVFLDRYPEVRDHFLGVNMKHQAVLLTMALLAVERNSAGSYPATQMYLRYLGSKHKVRGIDPDLYPLWREAMLGTLERFHSQDWSPELCRQWSEALDKAIALILEGYQEHQHV
jgi:hemoglobin-like flavoprotein